MKYTIRYSAFAKEDVLEIKSYLSQFYPSTPGKFLIELKSHVELLKASPKMFEVYQDNPVYRKMPVLHYVVYYQIYEEENRVYIYRVLHGKQDREQRL